MQGRKLVKKSTGDVLGTITISIGVAQFAAGDTIESVIRRADACLYGAKQNGRNMVIGQDDPRMASLKSPAPPNYPTLRDFAYAPAMAESV